jgi:UDP-N-acetylmuramyl pentapeptide phosphotransferase/UDP-N-acetylglucosamine-1-phosphate transferase
MLTFVAIPSIINIAKVKRLMDEPGERRSHQVSIPTLGGIAIFAGVVFSIVLWTPFQVFGNLQYILCAYIIIFLIGAKDDIVPMPPIKKNGWTIIRLCHTRIQSKHKNYEFLWNIEYRNFALLGKYCTIHVYNFSHHQFY